MLTQNQVDIFLKTLHNPRYINAEKKGAIIFDGEFRGQLLEFYASPLDAMDYGREIYDRALAGEFGPIGDYDPNFKLPGMK